MTLRFWLIAAGPYFLVPIGLAAFAGGILLLLLHMRQWRDVERSERDPRKRKFEARKFRRRSHVAAFISASGCIMFCMNWAEEPRTYALFLGLLLILLLAILCLAMLDLLSVSLNQFIVPDEKVRREAIEKYLALRKKQMDDQRSSDETDHEVDVRPSTQSDKPQD